MARFSYNPKNIFSCKFACNRSRLEEVVCLMRDFSIFSNVVLINFGKCIKRPSILVDRVTETALVEPVIIFTHSGVAFLSCRSEDEESKRLPRQIKAWL